MIDGIKTIAFDADDTLWANENFFTDSENEFCDLLKDYLPRAEVKRELLAIEIANMPTIGYGIKGFIVSMLETALKITKGNVPSKMTQSIISIGKKQLDYPVNLLPGVLEVLDTLKEKYKLMMITKGDLLEQQNKVKKSGIDHYFDEIEIISGKTVDHYKEVFRRNSIDPDIFLMIGNSVKSDVLPILELGGYAVHNPYETTWEYEKVDKEVSHPRFRKIENITQLLDLV